MRYIQKNGWILFHSAVWDSADYDIVSGGVANDRVFDTIELYFENLISRSEAIGRLAMEKPNMQICFRRQEIMDNYLKFERSYRV